MPVLRVEIEIDCQWSIRDSNPWPPQCECGALGLKYGKK